MLYRTLAKSLMLPTGTFLFLLLGALTALGSEPASASCSSEVVSELLSLPTKEDALFRLNCSVRLGPNDVITRPLAIEGSASSGLTLDCNGASIDGTGALSRAQPSTLVIRSIKTATGWDRPEHILVKNCRILGSTKVYGIGVSGNEPDVRASSLMPGHTQRAQDAAPRDITFLQNEFQTDAKLPFYVAPGATRVVVEGSVFKGRTQTVAIYLDAESADNVIADNVFDIRTDKRELIAVDGSARNQIIGNRFNAVRNGGIFLYRNCGEAGTIRHQPPYGNRILDNEFEVDGTRPAIWLNSRNGKSKFCFSDPARPFGSSLSPLDFARDNTVSGNSFLGAHEKTIRNEDPSNRIVENKFPE